MSPDPLAELRGYHLPDPVVWWPPAPGWWALAVLLSLLTLLGVHWFLVRRRRCEAARRALAEIRALKAGFVREPDAAAAARALSQLLRRFAIARFGVRQAAGLTGDDWLGLLDAHGGRDGVFLGDLGSALVEAPYRAAPKVDISKLMAGVEDWIRRNQEPSP